MTNPAKRGNFSCRNWRSFAWKHTTTLGSTGKRSSNSMINEKRVPSKLHFRWDGPFVITNVFLYGTIELKDEATNTTF
ncbi:hypothetical protein CR513_33834, partial [Mucuna pruriens]